MVRSGLDRLPALGHWWLPDLTDDLVFGQLEGQPGSIRLNLAGDFNRSSSEDRVITVNYYESRPQIPLVHGVINGALVSLLGLRTIGEPFATPGIPTTVYSPKAVVFGRWIVDEALAGPVGVQVEFSHLLRWWGIRGLTQRIQKVGDEDPTTEWKYESPPGLEWELRELSIWLKAAMHQERKWESAMLQEYGMFQANSKKPKSLDEWMNDAIEPIHEMLKLAYLNPVNRKNIRFKWDLDGSDNDELGNQIAEYVQNRSPEADNDTGHITDEEFLFRPADLSDQILERLLAPDEKVNRIRTRFLQYERMRQRLDDHFLAVVRQLESLHRVIYPATAEQRDAYTARLGRICEGLLLEDAKLVSGRMGYGFEPSLAKRIRELVNPWKADFVSLFGSKKKLNVEIEKIGWHRNYLAHELGDDRRIYHPNTIEGPIRLMMVIARLVVLKEAGFDDEAAFKAASGTTLFASVRSHYRDS